MLTQSTQPALSTLGEARRPPRERRKCKHLGRGEAGVAARRDLQTGAAALSRASSGTERGGAACAGSKAKSPPPGGNRGTSRPHLALRGTTWHYVAQDRPLHVVVGGCALSSEGVCILGFRPDLHRVQPWRPGSKRGKTRRPRGRSSRSEPARTFPQRRCARKISRTSP